MPCKICSKPIKKHDEADMIICLSKSFGKDELMTVAELISAATADGLFFSWGQPFAETSGTFMVQEKATSTPQVLVQPEVIAFLAGKLLEEEKPKESKALEQLKADLEKPVPEEAPKDAIREDPPKPAP